MLRLDQFEQGSSYGPTYEEDLAALQERLSRVLVAHIVHRRRSIIVVEGWDASGKGGLIQRLTARWDPRAFRVWPIGAPSREEADRGYLWRFWTRLPAAGQIAVFDRSWYGRVLVERVEKLAAEPDWRRAYDEINEFECQQKDAGTTIVKLFLHVTQETQDKRLQARLDHPWKRWKVTPEDFRNRSRRQEYLDAIHDMFAETNTRWAPWNVVDFNSKQSGRIAALKVIVDALERAVPMQPPSGSPEIEALAAEAFGELC